MQHTITLEKQSGVLAIVERYEGSLVKVCADATEIDPTTAATVARQYARAYGAVYVPPGK